MDLKKAQAFMDKQIEDLEKATYLFQNVVKPRYEADKLILEAIKKQATKIAALLGKQERGEEISQEEVYDCVPEIFR